MLCVCAKLMQMEEVEKAQRDRIVVMLLKGNIYGLPGSDGTVRDDAIRPNFSMYIVRTCG